MAAGRAPDVLIVGGGIIGCASALALARRGLGVTVVEAGTPGREATWAAGGMLSPLGEAGEEGPFLELASASFERWPTWIDDVREASGVPVEYRREGRLEVALDDAAAETLRAGYRRRRQAGAGVEWLDPAEALREEPALADTLRGAVLIADDHAVDNRALGQAAWAAAAAAGARFRTGERVAFVLSEGGRAAGALLVGGERIPAGKVVVAAGCWSGSLGGLPAPLPVEPVRGQMAAADTVPPPIRRVVVVPGSAYLVPRAAGQVVIGATVERAGYHKATTLAGVRNLLAAAVRAVPALGEAPLAAAWAGLRPGTPDDLPIMGEDPDMPGLFYATGHYRNGILLAPVTAAVVEASVLGEEPPLPLDPFLPGRFRRGTA